MLSVSRTLGHSSITVRLDVYSRLSYQDSELVADSMARRYGSESVSKNSKKFTTTNQLPTTRKSEVEGQDSK